MTVAEFGAKLEGYFGGTYTAVQMGEVKRWAENRTPRELELVYRYCVVNETAQYKTPPDIKALNRNLGEVFDAYPELRAGSHNQQIAAERRMLTDDAGWTDEEMDAALDKLHTIVSAATVGCRTGGES